MNFLKRLFHKEDLMNNYWGDWSNVMRETKCIKSILYTMIEKNGGIMPNESTIEYMGYGDMIRSLRRQKLYKLWRKVYGNTGEKPPMRMVEPPLNHDILNSILKY